MRLFKSDISLSTAASSAEMSHKSLDVTTSGGTPFSKMFLCCLAFGSKDDSELPPFEEQAGRCPPPIVVAGFSSNTEGASELKTNFVPEQEEAVLFDAGLVCSMAILGGVLMGQAFNFF